MMTTTLKNIKEFTNIWKLQIKNRIAGTDIKLGIVQVGSNPASSSYVRNKMKDCQEVGISAFLLQYPEDISEAQLLEVIRVQQEHYDAFMVQLPLPAHISVMAITEVLDSNKDVDGFTCDSLFKPCTPSGIITYLDYCGFDPIGQHVVIIGRSDIVGKPLARMMTDRDATVTLCHSKTELLGSHTHAADLIVCAVGKEKFLDCQSLYCPIIDVGINFNADGKLVGDCFNTEGRNVTPVPGGVGLLTRCALLENVSRCL